MATDKIVLLLKLVTGEEIISKLVDEDSTGAMTLHKPYLFETTVDENGDVSGDFVPYMPLAEGSYIQLSHRPVCTAIPSEKAIDSYLRMIGDVVIQTQKPEIIIPR